MIAYPTTEQVEAADAVELLRWYRFLPSPGAAARGSEEFDRKCNEESAILERIKARLESLGGVTPEISKAVGWGEE